MLTKHIFEILILKFLADFSYSFLFLFIFLNFKFGLSLWNNLN